MKAEGIDREVLRKYVEMRREITKRIDRTVALVHLLSLLQHCGDDEIEVSPMALAVVADLVESEVCRIQEILDDFIYVVEAEEVLGRGSEVIFETHKLNKKIIQDSKYHNCINILYIMVDIFEPLYMMNLTGRVIAGSSRKLSKGITRHSSNSRFLGGSYEGRPIML